MLICFVSFTSFGRIALAKRVKFSARSLTRTDTGQESAPRQQRGGCFPPKTFQILRTACQIHVPQQSFKFNRRLICRIYQSHLVAHQPVQRRTQQRIMRTSHNQRINVFFFQRRKIPGGNLVCYRIMEESFLHQRHKERTRFPMTSISGRSFCISLV